MVQKHVLRRLLSGLATVAAVALLTPQIGSAALVPPGSYVLGDHPDGAISSASTPYGLRVDALPETFSVEQGGAEVVLSWGGGATAAITGQVRNNSTLDLWDVSYDITGVVADPAGMGFRATGGSGKLSHGMTEIEWNGKQDSSGFAFLFLGDGHRLDGDNDSIVGRGWLDLEPGPYNDWLVTATPTPVPVPSAFILFGTGLGALVLAQYRKNRL